MFSARILPSSSGSGATSAPKAGLSYPDSPAFVSSEGSLFFYYFLGSPKKLQWDKHKWGTVNKLPSKHSRSRLDAAHRFATLAAASDGAGMMGQNHGSTSRITFNLNSKEPPSHLSWSVKGEFSTQPCKRLYWCEEQRFCVLQPCYGSKGVWNFRVRNQILFSSLCVC